jgi:hypothetical protein
VTWLHAPGEHPAGIDALGVLTARCSLARTPFDARDGGSPLGIPGQPLVGLTPRWTLWPAAVVTADADDASVQAAPTGGEPATFLARGRFAPLPIPGAYQGSIDTRRYEAGGRYVLCVAPDVDGVGVRNGVLSFTLAAPTRP